MDKSKKKILVYPHDVSPKVIYSNYITVPEGKSWVAHNINDLELVFVLNGVFSARDKDHQETELKSGDILLIRPGIPCDLIHKSYGNPTLISCIHFELLPDKKWIDGAYDITPSTPWIVNSGRDISLVELFRRSATEFANFAKYRDEILSAIFKQIWLIVMRLHLFGENLRSSRLDAMLEYIRRNCSRNITRADLSNEFRLTPQYINFIFKKHIGMSPGEVIMREKIRVAAEIISKGKFNISEIAFHLGFSDPLYFSRVFRKIMGVPPSKFR